MRFRYGTFGPLLSELVQEVGEALVVVRKLEHRLPCLGTVLFRVRRLPQLARSHSIVVHSLVFGHVVLTTLNGREEAMFRSMMNRRPFLSGSLWSRLRLTLERERIVAPGDFQPA